MGIRPVIYLLIRNKSLLFPIPAIPAKSFFFLWGIPTFLGRLAGSSEDFQWRYWFTIFIGPALRFISSLGLLSDTTCIGWLIIEYGKQAILWGVVCAALRTLVLQPHR